jgi:DNA-binding transcriptional regulator YdaS (Cro superfamily)
MNQEPLLRAINLAGGQSALARLLGIRQGQVACWLYRDKHISAKHILAIERVTNGQVKRYELRPDLYPPEEYEDIAPSPDTSFTVSRDCNEHASN